MTKRLRDQPDATTDWDNNPTERVIQEQAENRILLVGTRPFEEKISRAMELPAEGSWQIPSSSGHSLERVHSLSALTEELVSRHPGCVIVVDGKESAPREVVRSAARILTRYEEVQLLVCLDTFGEEWKRIARQMNWSNSFFLMEKSADGHLEALAAGLLSARFEHNSGMGDGVEDECDQAASNVDSEPSFSEVSEGAECPFGPDKVCPSSPLPECQQLATELRSRFDIEQARKLEAIGQLASGVAHEINTPIQFISDSVYFIEEAFEQFQCLLTGYRDMLSLVDQCNPRLQRRRKGMEDRVDLDYLLDVLPGAFERATDGLEQVTKLVQALKEFAPRETPTELRPTDLNKSVRTALIVARNEYKYIADVQTDFAQIPMVDCHRTDLNQVFLNLIINAAHAIEEHLGDSNEQGQIEIRSRREADHVVVSIRDNGGGIPEELRHEIFNPFFTTKPLGKGTGQGLAIAWTSVVEKHNGQLYYETELGHGTTFYVKLPIRHTSSS